MLNTDFIITLAWPNGMIYSPGGVYDKLLGSSKRYKIGHTAFALIDSNSNKIFYFDFGRYHTPSSHGRVRDHKTDPNLCIEILADINDNSIRNINSIISEINQNVKQEEPLYYKVINHTNFKNCYYYSKFIQNYGLIKFGVFTNSTLNCGRFVYNVIKKSNLKKIVLFKTIINDIFLRIPLLKYFSIKLYFK